MRYWFGAYAVVDGEPYRRDAAGAWKHTYDDSAAVLADEQVEASGAPVSPSNGRPHYVRSQVRPRTGETTWRCYEHNGKRYVLVGIARTAEQAAAHMRGEAWR